jgi:hypothetical protein
MAFAFAAMARVGDGLIACARFAIPMVIVFSAFREWNGLKFLRFYHSVLPKSNGFSAGSRNGAAC